MREVKARKLRRIYGIFLSAFTVIVGVLFIIQVWRIFLPGGKGNYTTESIAARFSEIAVFVWLWVASVVIGGVLAWVNPLIDKERPKAYVATEIQLKRLSSRVAVTSEKAKKEQSFREVLRIACVAVCCVATVAALAVLFDKSYTPKVEKEFFSGTNAVVDRLVSLLPWILTAFAAAIAAAYLSEYSRKREVQALKEEIAASGKIAKAPVKEKKETTENNRAMFITRIVLAVVGVVFVIVGIANGGMLEVFKKAINICTQCIGLG